MKRFVLAVALASAGSTACAGRETQTHPPPGPSTRVAVATVHREPLPLLYRASGTVRGRTTAVLTSKTTGYIRSIRVHAGDTVAAGDVLAELEANDTRATVARTRAELERAVESRAEADSALQAAHVAAELAKSNRERVVALFEKQAVARQEYDEEEARWQGAVAQENMARARLRAVTSSIDEAKAALAETQAALGYAKIVAPFAGRIVERRVDPGALASPDTPLLVLSDEGLLRVETAIDESRAPDIEVGDSATVEIDMVPEPFTSTVSEIVPNVDVASRSFVVKLDFPPGAAKLRPGMFARVTFNMGSKPRLVVPSTSITSFGALDRVFVVDGDTARLRMITRGETQGPWTEVLSGLTENENVASAPTAALEDGSRVEIAR